MDCNKHLTDKTAEWQKFNYKNVHREGGRNPNKILYQHAGNEKSLLETCCCPASWTVQCNVWGSKCAAVHLFRTKDSAASSVFCPADCQWTAALYMLLCKLFYCTKCAVVGKKYNCVTKYKMLILSLCMKALIRSRLEQLYHCVKELCRTTKIGNNNLIPQSLFCVRNYS